MKKTIINIIFLLLVLTPNFVNAEETETTESSSGERKVEIIVNTDVPGGNCTEFENKIGEETITQYKCSVTTSTGAVTSMLGEFIKWLSYIVGLIGVVFLVYGGILYSLSGINPSAKEKGKEKITQILLGIIFLLLSGTFLVLIAPWVYSPK